MSSAVSESESDAKSSVAGAQGKNSDSSGKDVDQKKNDQQGYADKTAKGQDNQAKVLGGRSVAFGLDFRRFRGA